MRSEWPADKGREISQTVTIDNMTYTTTVTLNDLAWRPGYGDRKGSVELDFSHSPYAWQYESTPEGSSGGAAAARYLVVELPIWQQL